MSETPREHTAIAGGQPDELCALIVDDDPVHVGIIGRVAAAAGYRVVEASTFDEAAELLQARSFDCVSLDLSLGRHDGVEVLNLIARLGLKMPIIVISGADAEARNKAVAFARQNALNVYPPMAKPLSLVDLNLAFRTIRARTAAGL
jgi:DNA-binding response OmpR family regulator